MLLIEEMVPTRRTGGSFASPAAAAVGTLGRRRSNPLVESAEVTGGRKVLVGTAGCSLPALLGGSAHAARGGNEVASDTSVLAAPIVQVRTFPNSAVVSVVAWDKSDAAFGLRTSVTRTGELIGGLRFGDHRLYLTPLYARDMGGFAYASVPPGRLLLGAGAESDVYSCFYGKDCSPMTTVGVRIPDSLLRADRDSLAIAFVPRVLEPWKITLRRELIDAYLARVDSVITESRTIATPSDRS